jgi:hypothetical protein
VKAPQIPDKLRPPGIPIKLKAQKGSKQRSPKQCKAQTKAGGPCRAPALAGGFCHTHPEKLAELGRQGGQKNRRWKRDELDLSQRPLKSIGDVSELLAETISRVRQGPFDLRAANAIGFLAGIHLKALDQRFEERLAGAFAGQTTYQAFKPTWKREQEYQMALRARSELAEVNGQS